MGFMTLMYPSDPVLAAPMPLQYKTRVTAAQDGAGKVCTAKDAESRMPTFEELVSLWVNRDLVGYEDTWAHVWSSSTVVENNTLKGRVLDFPMGAFRTYSRDGRYTVLCVKR